MTTRNSTLRITSYHDNQDMLLLPGYCRLLVSSNLLVDVNVTLLDKLMGF